MVAIAWNRHSLEELIGAFDLMVAVTISVG